MVRVDTPRSRTLALILGGALAGGALAAGSSSSRYAPPRQRPARMRRPPPAPTRTMASSGMAGSGSSRAAPRAGSHAASEDAPAGSGSSSPRPTGRVELASKRSEEARRLHRGIRRAILHDQALKGGFFLVVDKEARKVRVLKPRRLHDSLDRIASDRARAIVHRAGGEPAALEAAGDAPVYLACADFQDVRTGEVVDVDLWVTTRGDLVQTVQVLLHQVAGRERFSYRPGERAEVE